MLFLYLYQLYTCVFCFFFFKQKTAYYMRISDGSSYVCSSDLLYTIVVPQQNLSDGVLTLRVVEGYIDDVVITGDVKGRGLDLVRRYAARLAAEKPLRRPTLERYLSLIRDIPGLETEVQLLNLQTAGAVRLVLTLKHDDLDFGLVVNNRGIANLGRTQVQANATANSLFRQGDQTRLTVRSEEHTSELQSLMRISYAVFCLKKQNTTPHYPYTR